MGPEREQVRRYYELHEEVYQKLRERGEEAWGAQDYERFDLLPFLEEILERLSLPPRAKVLELGCGSGPLSCALAERGFQVEGIDISATAIEMGQEQAQRRGLSIHFRVADLCRDFLKREGYDLIIDAHCLHCIALEEERSLALANIHQALKPRGYFASKMMLGHTPEAYSGLDRLDEQGRCWRASDLPGNPREWVDGRWWILQRLIRKRSEEYLQEFEAAGFSIIWQEVLEDSEGFKDYRAIMQFQ